MSSEPPPRREAPSPPVRGMVEGPPSVLDALRAITGAEAPRVVLRDSPGADALAPVIKPGETAAGFVPHGRAHYQLQGEIARGGMGVILKGHDLDLGRDVAIKVLREDLAKRPEILQRFVEEAQIGGQLQHPGIVPVYELGLMADQRPYFAMKLVKGRTLADRLIERSEGGRRRLLDVFEAVCQTMAYAHSKGVVHRDLKPANVLIGAFGEVQVVDWGLAKVLARGGVADEARARESRATHASVIATVRSGPAAAGSQSLAGSVLGTPAYMPPEQARGDVERLDERSDVFSLGAILCEILTGRPPYSAEPQTALEEAANARLDDALQRLAACGADPELAALARECLAPAPSARPRSAEALAERVHAHLASVEERARAAQVRAAEAKVRARATALLSAAGIAIVLLGGGGWLVLDARRGEQRALTAAGVSAALSEATLHRGERDWTAAQAAVEQARALLGAGEPDDALRGRVEDEAAIVARGAAEATHLARIERENRELLELLSKLSTAGVGPTDHASIDEALFDAFSAYDLELDLLDVEEAARLLAERGIGRPVAAVLDRWAQIRTELGRTEDGDHLLRIAESADPDPVRRRLRAAIRSGDLGLLKEFARDSDLERMVPESLCLLASAFLRSGARPRALHVLRLARASHPGHFEVHVGIGDLLRSSTGHEIEEAVQSYVAALALRPDHARLHAVVGALTATDLGEPQRGVPLLERAVRLDPRDPWIRTEFGWALHDLWRPDGALEQFEEAARLAPGRPSALRDLAFGQLDQGHFAAAIATARTTLELDPTDEDAIIWLITALLDSGDVEGATVWMGVLDRNGVRSLESIWTRAAVRAATDDLEGARAAIESAIVNSSVSRLVPMLLQAWYLGDFPDPRLRDGFRAREAALRAVEMRPRSAKSWDALAVARLRCDDWKGCIEAAERAIGFAGGGSAWHFLTLAIAHHRLGQTAKAIELHRDAVAWIECHGCRHGGLTRLRREAEVELGIAAERDGDGR